MVTSDDVYPEGGRIPLTTFDAVLSPKHGSMLTVVVPPEGIDNALNLTLVTLRPAVVAQGRRAWFAPQLNWGIAVYNALPSLAGNPAHGAFNPSTPQSLGNNDEDQLYVGGLGLHKPPGHSVATLSHDNPFRDPPEQIPAQTKQELPLSHGSCGLRSPVTEGLSCSATGSHWMMA